MFKRIIFVILTFILCNSLYAEPERIVFNRAGMFISTNRDGMVQVSADGGNTWQGIGAGLPEKFIYPFDSRQTKEISSIYYDETTGCMVACGSDFISLYDVTSSQWIPVLIKSPVKERAYFTSVTMSVVENSFKITVGTACDGIFTTTDMGYTWKVVPSNRFYIGGGFFEEITALCPASGTYSYYAAAGPDNLIYGFLPDIQRWKPLPTPQVVTDNSIHDITDDGQKLRVFSGDSVFESSYDCLEWYKFDDVILPYKKKKVEWDKLIRTSDASGRTGIYLSFPSGRPGKLENHIAFLKKHGMNSFVIDLKNDFGNITCGTENPVAISAGSAKEYFNLRQLLDTAHKENIYVIGRIVVFKDEKLYNYAGNKYAVRNISDGTPWRHFSESADGKFIQKEYWVDPFCEDVWDYNIALAKEFQDAGVDEIQFDYIRFPTDGAVSQITYPYKREGMTNSDALESFFKKAREVIHIPISVDFYGFNGWYKMEKWNGQNLDMASKYVDVVSPMFYPSHFSGDFHKSGRSYMEWAKYIYKAGTKHARNIAGYNGCLIRPFVQAFLVGEELKLNSAGYFEYFNRQIEGLQEENASGFTLWNSSNRYYMVPDDFKTGEFIPEVLDSF